MICHRSAACGILSKLSTRNPQDSVTLVGVNKVLFHLILNLIEIRLQSKHGIFYATILNRIKTEHRRELP